MPMPYGFRIKQSWTRVDDAIVAAFRELPAANVSDSMQRLAAAGPAIQPMHGDAVLCGPALTVRCRPGDNLMLHKAIDMAQPGDVIVAFDGTPIAESRDLPKAVAAQRPEAGAGRVDEDAIGAAVEIVRLMALKRSNDPRPLVGGRSPSTLYQAGAHLISRAERRSKLTLTSTRCASVT